jgi:hypothetical protein
VSVAGSEAFHRLAIAEARIILAVPFQTYCRESQSLPPQNVTAYETVFEILHVRLSYFDKAVIRVVLAAVSSRKPHFAQTKCPLSTYRPYDFALSLMALL